MPRKNKENKINNLYRSESDRVIAGVCGGLGEFLGIDSTIIRIIFILTVIFGGWGLVVYIILWIVIPSESKLGTAPNERVKENVDEIKAKAKNFASEMNTGSNETKVWAGVIIAFIGFLFLFNNFGFFHIFSFSRIWPLVLIALGLVIIFRNEEK